MSALFSVNDLEDWYQVSAKQVRQHGNTLIQKNGFINLIMNHYLEKILETRKNLHPIKRFKHILCNLQGILILVILLIFYVILQYSIIDQDQKSLSNSSNNNKLVLGSNI